jgi:hypothetical protein
MEHVIISVRQSEGVLVSLPELPSRSCPYFLLYFLVAEQLSPREKRTEVEAIARAPGRKRLLIHG